MRGSYYGHAFKTDAVEKARDLQREAAELRLARIQNGADPAHKNGPWPVVLTHLTGEVKGWQWTSDSGRKSPIFRGEQAAKDWRTAHPQWD